jgi:hypothetical protein
LLLLICVEEIRPGIDRTSQHPSKHTSIVHYFSCSSQSDCSNDSKSSTTCCARNKVEGFWRFGPYTAKSRGTFDTRNLLRRIGSSCLGVGSLRDVNRGAR